MSCVWLCPPQKLDYDWVKNTVYALINNEIDISAYEDDLRHTHTHAHTHWIGL